MVLGHRRALLAAYDNQADVTVMMIEDSSSIPGTMTELNISIANSTLLVSMRPPVSVPVKSSFSYVSYRHENNLFCVQIIRACSLTL